MDNPNAFIGIKEKPSAKEVAAALGTSAKVWEQLVGWLAKEHGVSEEEWKSISPKYGWSLRLKLKKRTIVHMSPCKGSFRVAFALGDRAVKAALQSDLPKNMVKLIEEAPRYAEGRGVRLEVKDGSNLAAIRKLAEIKLAN
jgi:hypothetical protein